MQKAFAARLAARLSATLLGGISLTVLPAGLAAGAALAQAMVSVSQGADGRNAYISLFAWGDRYSAEPGADGGPVSLMNAQSNLAATGTTVRVGSIGGRGGKGASSGFSYEYGRTGGRGGQASLVQTGAIAGQGAQKTAVPLLSVFSEGGDGGNADSGLGRGGEAGAVTFDLASKATTTGENFAAILATSKGGDAGSGGDFAQFARNDHGGNGGSVTVRLGATSIVSTAGKDAPAVVAQSIGGHGGDRTNAFYSEPLLTDGGAGGAVSVTNAGTLATSGKYSTALVAQSVGGRGDAAFNAGDGGKAAPGGMVSIVNAGTIRISGLASSGLVAQSIGGGNPLDAFQSRPPSTAPSGGGRGGTGVSSFPSAPGRRRQGRRWRRGDRAERRHDRDPGV